MNRSHQDRIAPFAIRLLLLVALLLAGLPTLPARAASGSFSPAAGAAGTLFSFVAEGLGSSEQIEAWLEDPRGRTRSLGTDVASNRIFSDPDGNASWVWQSPDDAPGGNWLAIARGSRSRTIIRIPFIVEGTQTGAPQTSFFVEPRSGVPGTTFTFVGRSNGFAPGEQVGSWFIQPDGTVRDVEQGQSVDPNGQIFRLWTAPLDAEPGTWVFRALGISTGYTLDMTFRIDHPTEPIDLPPPPPLFVEPTSGLPGTVFSFTVGGFARNEIVGNWLIRPDLVSQDAGEWLTADVNGVLTWQWASPPDTPAGVWRFRTNGTQTRGYQEIAFVVEGDNPISPSTDLPPGQAFPSAGLAGTTFTLNAEGFLAEERAYFWLATDAGQPARDGQNRVIAEGAELRADREGRIAWTWQAPQRMLPGSYQIIVQGRLSSPYYVQIPLTITDPNRPEGASPSPVVPEDGSPGVEFTFYADGFNVHEFVDIYFIDPDGRTVGRNDPNFAVTDLKTNRFGSLTWQWKAPRYIRAGRWQTVVEACDSRVVRTIGFNIFTTTEVPVRASVTPEQGQPGTTFTFTADGYPRGRRVGYWLTRPDGTIVRVGDPEVLEADESGVDRNGRVTVVWNSPDTVSLQRGVWHLTMRTSKPQTVDEDITTVIYFTIE